MMIRASSPVPEGHWIFEVGCRHLNICLKRLRINCLLKLGTRIRSLGNDYLTLCGRKAIHGKWTFEEYCGIRPKPD